MEQLIGFLLGNFHFVLVGIGILYMLLRKSPLEKPPSGRPGSGQSGRMPDFGGGGLPRPMRPAGEPKPAPRRAQQPVQRHEGPGAHDRPWPPQASGEAGGRETAAARSAGERQVVYRSPGSPPPAAVPWDGEGESGGEGVPSASAAQSAREDAAYHAATSRSLPAQQPQAGTARQRPKRSELAQAVVWAEILGPPRSRKPHRR